MEDSGFSGVVRLSNVSDFIAPNLDCIIPLENNTRLVEKKEQPSQVTIKPKKNKENCDDAPKKNSVKISLADCLACNGCITSAETVLVEEQSFGRLWEGVQSSKLSVVTISPQTICSIAVKFNKTPSIVAKIIVNFFTKRGINYVIDSSFARQISHSLMYEEFLSTPSSSRPLLSSACPGFICYAEKSHGELLLPKISKIRSPQAITGALIKNYMALKLNVEPAEIFHATVMPCFDKKLEASREQFKIPGTEMRETDCVVSSAELFEELMADEILEDVEYEKPVGWMGTLHDGIVLGETGGASGGYAEKIIEEYLARNGGKVTTTKLNKHMDSITIENEGGEIVLRVSRVYGFRNVQNLVRKMKTKKEKTDYVEVMACPGGCGNGGGQIRYSTIDERENALSKVDALYEQLPKKVSEDWRIVLEEWKELNPNYLQYLTTDYKAVETNISQTLKW